MIKKLNAVKLVKEMSRDRIGQVKTVRSVPNKRRVKIDKARRREEREENA